MNEQKGRLRSAAGVHHGIVNWQEIAKAVAIKKEIFCSMEKVCKIKYLHCFCYNKLNKLEAFELNDMRNAAVHKTLLTVIIKSVSSLIENKSAKKANER